MKLFFYESVPVLFIWSTRIQAGDAIHHPTSGVTLFSLVLPRYLVDEADGWGLAAIQEVNIDDLQLLQPDVEGLELTVVPVQWDHLE